MLQIPSGKQLVRNKNEIKNVRDGGAGGTKMLGRGARSDITMTTILKPPRSHERKHIGRIRHARGVYDEPGVNYVRKVCIKTNNMHVSTYCASDQSHISNIN